MTPPLFAIVGHPNKGKSSIVSTLARDQSVAISPIPGTTVEARRFPLKVDGKSLYELVDTPGFQRARAMLEWLRSRDTSAANRAELVREFVECHRDDSRFSAECNLLTPILSGAGILYVVDGSRPFGQEYEAEMEILRWCGQPSMALINMIGSGDHIDEWQRALGQYFRIVRTFNAFTANFDKRIQLLLAFAQLNEAWREPLDKAVAILNQQRQQQRQISARKIARTITKMITFTHHCKLSNAVERTHKEAKMKKTYHKKLTEMEQQCRREVELLYNHKQLERHEPAFKLLNEDLFAEETWTLFGLKQDQLLTTGAVGGAAAGSVIDLAAGGSSLLLGAGVGALIGGASAWFGADQMARIELLGLPLGGKELRVGPMRNINFPYVVLGRALLHHEMVEKRTHAHRDPLELDQQASRLQQIESSERKALEKIFSKLRKDGQPALEMVDALATAIEPLICGDAEQKII